VDSIDPKANPEEDDTVRIFACATMWHENKQEMLQMLKAIVRLDFDQGVQQVIRKRVGETEDYFELEGTII